MMTNCLLITSLWCENISGFFTLWKLKNMTPPSPLGERVDPDQVFRCSSSMAPPPPVLGSAHMPSHRLDTALMETPQDTLVLCARQY